MGSYKPITTLEELDAVGDPDAPPTPMKIGGATGRPGPGRLTPSNAKPKEPNPIEEDLPQIDALRSKFENSAKRYGVPPEILAAISSRESRTGKHLNSAGYDEEKKAYGIMQIDERYHKRRGKKPDSQEHIDQAAEILSKNKKEIDKRFPKWSEEQRMQAAVAAYNFGVGNVKTWKGLDKGTTGDNYSADVMERSRAYREYLDSQVAENE